MPAASDAHALGGIVDNIDHAPIAHPKAPLIFVALEFLHPAGRGSSARKRILRSTRLKAHRQARPALSARRFFFDVVASHAGGCVSNDRRGIARKEYSFLF